ncbi:MAG: F0F1 ATP synthase subunit B [Planctomycetota bacterium]
MLARLIIPATFGLCLALMQTAAYAAEKAAGDPKDQLFSRDPFSYVWNLLMFLILLGVLWKFVWPKILGGLQAREEKQLGDLDAAEKARAEAEASLTEYKAQLAEARKEAQSIVAEARTAAQQAANADRAKIEAEVAQLKENAQRDIASAKEQALADIYSQAASLSTEIAGKILGREISADDQQSLVNASVEQFKQSASSN